MKIHKISLNNYNQFNNLEIDLTYPKGHKKEGKPLDKICFIGQSGTGKTSLLRLIKYFITNKRGIGTGVSLDPIEKDKVKMIMSFDKFLYEKFVEPKSFLIHNITDKSDDSWFSEWQIALSNHFSTYKPILINFPTERLVNKNEEVINDEIIKNSDEKKNKRIKYLEDLKPGEIVDFAFEDSSKAWDLVLSDIKKHQSIDLEWRSKISEIILKTNSEPSDFEKINREFQNWLTKNPNPLDLLAKEINKILIEFGIKIKTDIDKESIFHIGSILLQTLDGKTIDRDFWSTGTKQIIDTAIPLIEIKPKNAIILIDEPERSLYPNLQQRIIDFYTNLGNNCQFFFATHSPIIASAFDPWEIIELKFDESKTNVIQEKNYLNERHIDNYTVFPKYLKWDGILMKLFDLTDEGNNKYRQEELQKVASLKNELNELKNKRKNKGAAFEKKLNEFIKLKNKVGWDEKTE
ncbi:MAG: ATP-binding protein [Bacteroidetes bacterium]|nr:ATP-binding protein [Bacteroidota bacterium]